MDVFCYPFLLIFIYILRILVKIASEVLFYSILFLLKLSSCTGGSVLPEHCGQEIRGRDTSIWEPLSLARHNKGSCDLEVIESKRGSLLGNSPGLGPECRALPESRAE